jgi:hypothetical protein
MDKRIGTQFYGEAVPLRDCARYYGRQWAQ